MKEKKAELRRQMIEDIQNKIWRMEEEKRELEESRSMLYLWAACSTFLTAFREG
jgi:hypothetical protein